MLHIDYYDRGIFGIIECDVDLFSMENIGSIWLGVGLLLACTIFCYF